MSWFKTNFDFSRIILNIFSKDLKKDVDWTLKHSVFICQDVLMTYLYF